MYSLVVFFASHPSWAGPVNDAQNKLSAAYSDFYRSYRASKNKSPDEAERLNKKILLPASSAVTRAMQYESVQALKGAGIRVIQNRNPVFLSSAEEKPEETSNGSRSAQTGPVGAPSSPPGSVADDRAGLGMQKPIDKRISNPQASENPDIAIDGSNVPKEVQFPGKPRTANNRNHKISSKKD